MSLSCMSNNLLKFVWLSSLVIYLGLCPSHQKYQVSKRILKKNGGHKCY
ncbi:hypothetical protein Hanom_Chr15g01408931 [Helianthus anomalus]